MKKYKVYYQENNEVKIKVLNEVEIKNFAFDIIKVTRVFTFKIDIFNKKIKRLDLINIFSQMHIMLSSNILFLDCINILLKNTKDKNIINFLYTIKNAINSGEEIHKALGTYETKMDLEVIHFFKLGANKVKDESIIKAIKDSLIKKHNNKSLIISKLSYPLFVLFTFFISLIMIFLIVLPKFEYIFSSYNLSLPFATRLLLSTKDFFISYSLFISFLFLLSFIVFSFVYKRNYRFALFFDSLILRVPFIGKMILLYELSNFFTSLDILIKAKFDFSLSLKNSIFLLKNKYLLDKIKLINKKLENGLDLSSCFKDANIFDDVVLSLIDTGLKSSSLNITVSEIVKINEHNFNKSIKRFASIIEPVFFIAIMILILWLILSIFVPLWSIQEVINV